MHLDSTNRPYASLLEKACRGRLTPGKEWRARWFDICGYFNEIYSSMLKMTQLKTQVVYVQFGRGAQFKKQTKTKSLFCAKRMQVTE